MPEYKGREFSIDYAEILRGESVPLDAEPQEKNQSGYDDNATLSFDNN